MRRSRERSERGAAIAVASILVALALAASARAGDEDRTVRKPPASFVLVVVDDLGWADLGCTGSRFYETPHIDRLAAEGMRFTEAYAAAAVCSPTRAAILTGRYPARLGLTDWIRAGFQGGGVPADGKNPSGWEGGVDRKLLTPRNPFWMELDEITIAEVLRREGYATCHVGKWHLGFENARPEAQGFDRNVGGCDLGQPPSYFDPYEAAHGRIPTLAPRRAGEYLTDREADEAVRFLRENRDHPFYLQLWTYAVHTPLQAKPDRVAGFEAKAKETVGEQRNAVYAAMVASVDDAVGRVLGALEELGLADRTVVLFTSDNGGLVPCTSNAPLRAGKGTPYEGGIRVPLVVRWPGRVRGGSTCDVPVHSVDLLPTIVDAAGLPLPDDRPVDGRSLVPLLCDTGSLEREALFWYFPHYRGGGIRPYGVVRAGEWKLIRWLEGERSELYRLGDDLSESRDLAVQEPERARALEALLAAWLSKVGARPTKPNPDFAGAAGDGKDGE